MWPGFGLTAGAARKQAGQAVSNWGQLATWGTRTAWNSNIGRGAMIGAAAGGLWGGFNRDPEASGFGSTLMGAVGGAVAGRYGSAGMRWAKGSGQGLVGFGRGVRSQARLDFRNLTGTGGKSIMQKRKQNFSDNLKTSMNRMQYTKKHSILKGNQAKNPI